MMDYLREIISEDFILILFGVSVSVGLLLFFIMFFYSILRIEREMKRDGMERPCQWDITMMRTPLYLILLKDTAENLERRAKTIADVDIYVGVRVKDIAPYIKTIDRYIARAIIFFGFIFFIAFLISILLYPDA